MADMILCMLTIDNDNIIVQNLHEYLIKTYRKSQADEYLINNMMNALLQSLTGNLKGNSMRKFHEFFKKFVGEIV